MTVGSALREAYTQKAEPDQSLSQTYALKSMEQASPGHRGAGVIGRPGSQWARVTGVPSHRWPHPHMWGHPTAKQGRAGGQPWDLSQRSLPHRPVLSCLAE